MAQALTHSQSFISSVSPQPQWHATPETAAHQAPPSLGFSRQEHWSGLPRPPDLPLEKPICRSGSNS